VTTNIIFTDRYGGNPPAWLRSCLECEAMGWSPEPCDAEPQPIRQSGHARVTIAEPVPCPRPAEHRQPDWDGWHFMRCTACSGTGRVSWLVSIARIPRWLAKGVRLFRLMSDRRYQPSHFTYWQHVWLVFKCAFVYDLMRLRR
jgi:hypothetical protein